MNYDSRVSEVKTTLANNIAFVEGRKISLSRNYFTKRRIISAPAHYSFSSISTLLFFLTVTPAFNFFSSVAVSRSKDVPPFGPPIPKSVTFPKSAVFRDFLLAKVINGENAAHKSEKFRAMATRTRQEYLKDLAENFVSTATIDSAVKFSFISLGGKKKEKVKPRKDAHLFSVGAITWSVRARDFGQSLDFDCLLGISNEFIVLIEEESKNVIFNCSCRDVIGWTSGIMSIKIFYERGECVMLSAHDNCGEDIREMVQRLEVNLFVSALE